MHPPTTIITALRHEARALRGPAQRNGWALQVCGPGKTGIERFVDHCQLPAGQVVILAGLAGGLNPGLEAGRLVSVKTVIDPAGACYSPPLHSPQARDILLGLDSICRTPPEKALLRDQTQADAVDLESARFAQLATERSWSWGIVRGISDDAASSLPRGCEHWTDPDGRLRLSSLLWSIARDPRLAFGLRGLQQKSSRAMRSVASELEQLLNGQSGGVGSP